MDSSCYEAILDYLKNGNLPIHFTSNKANFIAKAVKYEINNTGVLTRNSKICVLDTQRDSLYDALHSNNFDCSKKYFSTKT